MERIKKIIFTVTNDLTYDRRMQRICRTLANAGFDVMLIGRELASSIPLSEEPYRQHRIKCLHKKGKAFYLEYNYRLYNYLLGCDTDIVCAIDLDTIIPAFSVAVERDWKKVYDAHEYFSQVPEVVGRPLVQWIWEKVAKLYIPKADLCYTVGPALAYTMGQQYGAKFEVIRNVPFKVDHTISTTERSYLVYQGALNEGRGLEALLEAMQQIDMPLKIAGEGDLSKKLRRMSKELGVSNKVTFLGFVPPEQLPKLTEGAWLGLNLLENKGLSYYYSLANKFFDMIQAEVPSINMDFPEYKAIQQEYPVAILLNKLTPEAIVQAYKELKNDPARYEEMREACAEAKQAYNWEKEAQKLVTLYREL